jgi:hypothetical protein
MVLISALFLLIGSLIAPGTAPAAENLAMRHQLAVLNRKIHRPHLHRRDRFFWVILSQLFGFYFFGLYVHVTSPMFLADIRFTY